MILWDLVDGAELERLELELREQGGALPWPDRLDFDGTQVVLGRVQKLIDGPVALRPLLIESLDGGTIAELGIAGSPSLVK